LEDYGLTEINSTSNDLGVHPISNGSFKMSVISAIKDQVSSELGEEAVILNIKTGIYFGLNGVGARVWNLIQKPMAIAKIIETLLEEYDVEERQCEMEVVELVKDLIDAELVEINDGKNH
jgi:hypothetical protein